jgi:hypothetical protein
MLAKQVQGRRRRAALEADRLRRGLAHDYGKAHTMMSTLTHNTPLALSVRALVGDLEAGIDGLGDLPAGGPQLTATRDLRARAAALVAVADCAVLAEGRAAAAHEDLDWLRGHVGRSGADPQRLAEVVALTRRVAGLDERYARVVTRPAAPSALAGIAAELADLAEDYRQVAVVAASLRHERTAPALRQREAGPAS